MTGIFNFQTGKEHSATATVQKKLISISKAYLESNPFSVMKDTLLHEIAHALQFEKTGKTDHGNGWKEIAAKIGCKPSKMC